LRRPFSPALQAAPLSVATKLANAEIGDRS
jgi:hypothetical protein